VIPFAKLINKETKVNTEGINFFKSVGMSLFDLTAGEMITEKCIQKGMGHRLSI
jgi:ornithine cyclodeaminase/alanine dehydrogenase-like protein (mu-crystallin family)